MMKITESYNIFNVYINVLELLISLFILASKKKEWNKFIICFYGGFLLGMIPIYMIAENIYVALTGCVFLSVVLCILQKNVKQKLYIPLEIVMLKISLIISITLFDEWYTANKLKVFLLSLFVSVVLFFIVTIVYEIPLEKQRYINELFALLELSGVIIQLYRVDFSYFEKALLYDNKESISVLLYMLKTDFWIFDYQYLYVMCFFVLLLVYFVGRKVVIRYKTTYISDNNQLDQQ